MFSEQKWNILKSLSYGKSSPLQLAEKLNTTMANISQQLRLLEATNLVKKEKVKNRDKGKPRTLFSLNGDSAYLALAMQGFAGKTLLKVGEHQKIILRIWFLGPEISEKVESVYWKVKPLMDNVNFIAFDSITNNLVLVCEKKADVEKAAGKNKEIGVVALLPAEFEKMLKSGKGQFSPQSKLSIIYDKNNAMGVGSGGA